MNHVINLETRDKDRALGTSDLLLAYEAKLVHYQVLVDTLRTVAMTADCGLALVNEIEAERANHAFVVILDLLQFEVVKELASNSGLPHHVTNDERLLLDPLLFH